MNMAGNNIIAQFGAKLDAVQAQIVALSESKSSANQLRSGHRLKGRHDELHQG